MQTKVWMWFGLTALAAVLYLAVPATADEAPGDEGVAATEQATAGTGEAEALPGDEGSGQSRMEKIWDDLVINWKLGGPTMYFLAALALVGVVFSLERLFSLTRGRIAPRGLAGKANTLWQNGDFAGVANLGRRSGSTLGKVIAFLAEHREASYEHLTNAAEDIATRDFELHMRRNYPIAAVGTLAPLLGLMGTVFGLMGAFATIGVVGSMDDPAALAEDIGEALITTASGLIIAVPALAVYHVFRSRTGALASVLGEEVSNLIHAWFLKNKASSAPAGKEG